MCVLVKFQFSPENYSCVPLTLVFHIGTQFKQCMCTKNVDRMQPTKLLPGLRAAILTFQIDKL